MAVEGEQLENWFNDSTDAWQDDSVELYFDVGYDQLDAYGDDDYQRIFRFRDTVDNPTVDGFYSAAGMQTDFVTSYRHENDSTDVYQQLYEIRVKLSSIGLVPGETFGLEIAANDDDDGGDRDYKWGWWALPGFDNAWQQPSVFGKAKLQPID
ncbi:MAG: sugar-binding protein [Granulosicoccaceae bacterium]